MDRIAAIVGALALAASAACYGSGDGESDADGEPTDVADLPADDGRTDGETEADAPADRAEVEADVLDAPDVDGVAADGEEADGEGSGAEEADGEGSEAEEADAEGDSDDDASDGETTDGRRFSFAHITDLHIGDGVDDYGLAGWDDSDGPEDDVTATLRLAVAKVNLAADDLDIRFVVVTGDLGDSGERSEEAKAKEILDQFHVPYFPLIGNHDIWPYAGDVEAPGPIGDAVFEEIYEPQFELLAALFPSFTRAPTPVYNPECGCEGHFINYGLDYEGYHFVMLDLVTRSHAPLGYHGVTSEADLFDFEGGTWRWLTNHLESATGLGDRNTFVFSHHPPIVTSLGILDCLTLDEVDRIDTFLRDGGFGANLWGFFAGHHHLDYTLAGYEGQTIVVTPAEKDGSTVRVIQLGGDGGVDVGTFL